MLEKFFNILDLEKTINIIQTSNTPDVCTINGKKDEFNTAKN